MKELTDEQLSEFISRATPQLTPELTHEMFDIVQELIMFREKRYKERENRLVSIARNAERICSYIEERDGKVYWEGNSPFTIEGALKCLYKDIESARMKGLFVGTELAIPYSHKSTKERGSKK